MGRIKDEKKAIVYFNDQAIGMLFKISENYIFRYEDDFFNSDKNFPLSYNFPLTQQEFKSTKLFPFFEGLASEGWLLKIQGKNQKIDEKDIFSLLLENGEDLIGGTKIKKYEE